MSKRSDLRSIGWLLLIAHRQMDKLAGRGRFFDKWGALGNRRQDRRTTPDAEPVPPNIGGFVDLDSLDEDDHIGVQIVQSALEGADAAAQETRALLENDPRAQHDLASPFVAWTFVEAWSSREKPSPDYRFVEFVRLFWERRRAALERDLPVIAAAELGDYYRYVAELELNGAPDVEGLLHCLLALPGCEATGAAGALGQLGARRIPRHPACSFRPRAADFPERGAADFPEPSPLERLRWLEEFVESVVKIRRLNEKRTIR